MQSTGKRQPALMIQVPLADDDLEPGRHVHVRCGEVFATNVTVIESK